MSPEQPALTEEQAALRQRLTDERDAARMEHYEAVMRECVKSAILSAAIDEYPVSASLLIGGLGFSSRGSSLASGFDPTAHPEMTVMREAAQGMGSRYLKGAVLVTTLEPCPMCTAAALWAGVGTIVFGASQADAIVWRRWNPEARLSFRQITIPCADIVDNAGPDFAQPDVYGGVLGEECRALFDLGL